MDHLRTDARLLATADQASSAADQTLSDIDQASEDEDQRAADRDQAIADGAHDASSSLTASEQVAKVRQSRSRAPRPAIKAEVAEVHRFSCGRLPPPAQEPERQ